MGIDDIDDFFRETAQIQNMHLQKEEVVKNSQPKIQETEKSPSPPVKTEPEVEEKISHFYYPIKFFAHPTPPSSLSPLKWDFKPIFNFFNF